ncbi:hypothetical protein K469DRAFT_595485, partial [Zopfia rhizophila CBS 207.26]
MGQVYREGNKRLASIIGLLSHKKLDIKILEAGAGTGSATNEVLKALNGQSMSRKYKEYVFTDITTSFLGQAEEKFKDFNGVSYATFDMEKPTTEQGLMNDFDLFLAANVVHVTSDIKKTLVNIRKLLKTGAKSPTQRGVNLGLWKLTRMLHGTFSDFWKGNADPHYPRRNGPFLSKEMWEAVLPETGFGGVDFFLDDYAGDNLSTTVIVATAVQQKPVPAAGPIGQYGLTVVSPLEYAAENALLSDSSPLIYPRLLFLVEVENPLFSSITSPEWQGLQYYMKEAESALWVTNGGLHTGQRPLYAMISAIARGLKTEMPNLRLGLLDLDDASMSAQNEAFKVIMILESVIANAEQPVIDTEFRLHNGMVHISRLEPDEELNADFQRRKELQRAPLPKPLAELRDTPLRLDIEKPGVFSTLFFREEEDFDATLGADQVEIEVKAAGINNKDIAVAAGKFHSNTFSDECSGVIDKVGASVADLRPGDRVFCQKFAKFGNLVRSEAHFCQKMDDTDTFEEMATMPIAFCTAIYGLEDLGRLGKGQTVLVQSATGGVGLAAIQIALAMGAEVFATVGTEGKKRALL